VRARECETSWDAAAAYLRDDEAGIDLVFTRKLRQQVLSGAVRT
jgi:hypothetical protein